MTAYAARRHSFEERSSSKATTIVSKFIILLIIRVNAAGAENKSI